MRTQWTTKGNRYAGSCSCDRGLHRYPRNFVGRGVRTPPSRYANALIVMFVCITVKSSSFAQQKERVYLMLLL